MQNAQPKHRKTSSRTSKQRLSQPKQRQNQAKKNKKIKKNKKKILISTTTMEFPRFSTVFHGISTVFHGCWPLEISLQLLCGFGISPCFFCILCWRCNVGGSVSPNMWDGLWFAVICVWCLALAVFCRQHFN